MSLANPEVFEFAKFDPWLAIPGGLEAIRLYAPGMERTDWRISPVYGELSVLPKTLLLTGTRDILHPDCLVFVKRAREAGVEVELVAEPGMIHVWPLIDMPEALHARDRIVRFLREVDGESNGAVRRPAVERAGSIIAAFRNGSRVLLASLPWPI
jgi:acetyl esterase/lipase